MKSVQDRLVLIGRIMAAIFVIIAVTGVFSNSHAQGKYGRLKYNPEIIHRFASSAPLPTDMDVYFSGPADRPYAMIGIIKGVSFDPNIWRPISEEAENINKWRQMIHDYNDMLANPYFGYDILDPAGKIIGKWISYQRDTVVKMTNDNKITVYTPEGPRRMSDDPQRIGR